MLTIGGNIMIHSFEVIVRYAETDMMGIVHHSVYPIWAEAARTDLMKAMDYSYTEVEKSGIMLPVTEIRFIYKKPTFYEDIVTITCAVTHLDNRRLKLDYSVKNKEGEVCVIGYTKHLFMGVETRASMRIPSAVLDKFKSFYHPEFTQIP